MKYIRTTARFSFLLIAFFLLWSSQFFTSTKDIFIAKTRADAPAGGGGGGDGGDAGSAGDGSAGSDGGGPPGSGDGSSSSCTGDGDGCSGGDACVPEGTPVVLADGSTKPIEEIAVGESVSAYSFSKNMTAAAEVIEILHHAENDHPNLITFKTESGDLETTPDHRVMTTNGWKRAGELKIDDVVFVFEDSVRIETKILEISVKLSEAKLLTIRTQEENYFANGILIHTE